MSVMVMWMCRDCASYEEANVGNPQQGSVIDTLPPGWTVSLDARWPDDEPHSIVRCAVHSAAAFGPTTDELENREEVSHG